MVTQTIYASASASLAYFNNLCKFAYTQSRGMIRLADGKLIKRANELNGWARLMTPSTIKPYTSYDHIKQYVHYRNATVHSLSGPAIIFVHWFSTDTDRICLEFSWYRRNTQCLREEVQNTKMKEDRYECLITMLTCL